MSSTRKRAEKRKKGAPRPRGLDFLIRNEQGRWAEELVVETINSNETDFEAIKYGVSRAVMVKSYKEWVEYWEKYQKVEKYGKRPNVLVFRKSTFKEFEGELRNYIEVHGDTSLIPEETWEKYVKRAVCALEIEMSLWMASKMPGKNMKLPLKKLDVIAPMIWVKEEDANRLLEWYEKYQKPIYAIQVFYDLAYIAPLKVIVDKARKIKELRDKRKMQEAMKHEGLIIEEQEYLDGVTAVKTRKVVYRLHPAAAKLFGWLIEPPKINVELLVDEKGKIIPFLKFSNGKLKINPEILEEWNNLTI
jgi:type II restriction enzyme